MASLISIAMRALGINGLHVDRVEMTEETAQMHGEEYQRKRILLHGQPYKRLMRRCPVCGKECPVYDHQAKEEASWRAPQLNGVPVYIMYKPTRIQCKEHGVKTERIPWADGDSRRTESLSDEVAFLALACPKTVVTQYFAINWRTVGECIQDAHGRLEPDITQRWNGLKKICVDETSYRSGHRYMTVVYDMERNRVVWLAKGSSRPVFESFCKLLSQKQRDSIEVVAGDGARWITDCTKEYFKNATRCVDFFHVAQWANEALDKTRNAARAKAEAEAKRMTAELEELERQEREEREEILRELAKAREELAGMPKRGRRSKRKIELEQYAKELEERLAGAGKAGCEVTPEEYRKAMEELAGMPGRGRCSKRKAELKRIVDAYEEAFVKPSAEMSQEHKETIERMKGKAEAVKGAKYALGMNPENLSDSQKDKLGQIEASYPDLYKAYRLKEELRAVLHMTDAKTAEKALDDWIEEARESGAKQFRKLAEKVSRNKQGIVDAVRLQANSAKSEATNTTIKSLIATARGFRNLDNLFALVYLKCSDLVIPLNNRYTPSPKTQQKLREIQNERKKKRKEQARDPEISLS